MLEQAGADDTPCCLLALAVRGESSR